jgi:hypothetical protein
VVQSIEAVHYQDCAVEVMSSVTAVARMEFLMARSSCHANAEAVTHHRSQDMQHGAIEKLTLLRRVHVGAHISHDSNKEWCRVASLASSSSSSALFESKLLANTK